MFQHISKTNIECPKLTFVIGGAASGKSIFAESLASESDLEKIYLATTVAQDPETVHKINLHITQRGDDWITIEEPLDIANVLKNGAENQVILMECATLWLSNLMFHNRDIPQETQALLDAIQASPASIIIVSSEVGQGIVPNSKLSRQFRDAQGKLNQTIAQLANRAYLVCAGIPIPLKPQTIQ